MTFRALVIPNDISPVDVVLWRTYRREVPGLLEAALTRNPGLADLGPYPPALTAFVVVEPPPIAAPSKPVISLFD
jgi:phage tail protein X